MEPWAIIFILLIIVGGIIFLAVITTSNQGRGDLKIGRYAGFRFTFKRDAQAPRPSQKIQTSIKQANASTNCSLEIKRPGKEPWRYRLDKNRHTYIGRRKDNEIVLQDATTASRQAVIYWENGRFKINNLSDRPPTTINGRLVNKHNLGDGNTIQMGRTRMIFREKDK